MNKDKITVKEVIICEGKYDKIKLSSVLDADIVTLDGFGIFKSDEKKALIRHAAENRGIIVITDSDSAGEVLRSHIKSIVGDKGVTHLYTPVIAGKERRKKEGSKEGILGVEGIDADVLREMFLKFSTRQPNPAPISRADLYADGFIGVEGATKKREQLLKRLGLPLKMTTPALICAMSFIIDREVYKKICEELE